ncbi:MAG: ABC transporter ATP-binding protein [Ilumatobacteraceae bacterium]
MIPVLEFIDVSHQFPDSTLALGSTNLQLNPGEFVSIVGPSGCGKSTLLRIASGLLEPSSGSVIRNGSLQFVFQDSTLLPWRNVRKNIALNLELDDVDRHEINRRVDNVLQLVSMQDSAEKIPRQLSGGMKMRTSLARSLVCEPDIFLFDEPFSALDEFSRERLNSDLRAILARINAASLFITHSISEAVFLSDRVLVMSPRPGHIIEEFVIPFGSVRDDELRYTPEFALLTGRIASKFRSIQR